MTPWEVVCLIVFGLIVGAIAKLLSPGPDPKGCLITSALGIAGSLLGAWMAHAVGWHTQERYFAGYILSVIGAMLLLFVYRRLAAPPRE